MRLAVGARLGPYEIVAPLGAGGMGEVYKARDTRLERLVAIKVLPADKVADTARKQRFIQEARAASALNHPNIVTIHDISDEGDIHFLVMEYVPGKTLEQMVPRKGLRLSETLKYVVQIADALATAHSAGIVHRDVKPSNIMVTDHGRVKVLDFGLAKLTEPAEIAPDQPTRTALAHTEEGTVVGSAPYMSPEQAQGKPVDARSDIFSFGAVLYEMVTGQKAFHGDTRASVMASILKDEPKPARDLAEALPRELERIIVRCLRKDLDRRGQYMAEIKLELEELKEESESGSLAAATPAAAARSMRGYVIGTMLAVAFVLAGIWGFNSVRREAAPPHYRLRQMTRDEGISTSPALSPDGRLLAYSSDRGGQNNLDIWVQQVAGGEAIRLTRHPAADILPQFSPDGSQIVFQRAVDGIYVIPSLGGVERLLVKGGSRPAWSPDGRFIAYSMGHAGSREGYGLFIVPATAGAPRKVETGLATYCCPVWSPDGKHLLIEGSATGIGWDLPDWFIVPVEGGKPVKISVQTSLRRAGFSDFLRPVAWLGNRDLLILSAAQSGGGSQTGYQGAFGPNAGIYNIWQISVEPATGAFRASPQRLTAGSGEFAGPASLDGRIPFSTQSGGMTIYALPLDVRQGKVTGELVRIGRGGVNERFPTVTTDGWKMVFVSDRAGTNDVWTKDLVTGEESVLVGTPENEVRGLISPDGSQVIFQRNENGIAVNYVWPLPAGPERKLCDVCRSLLNWTSDGKSVLMSEREPESMILVDVGSGRRMLVAAHPKFAIHDGSISPDMRWIAFKLVTSSTVQPVYIAPVRRGSPVPEQEWIRISGDYYNHKPFWSPDGSLLYYYSLQDNFNCLYARRLDPVTKQPQGDGFAVKHFHGDQRLADATAVGYGLAPDRLYLPLVNWKGNIWLAEPEKSQ
jgi:Tol biopolymer transport system component